MNDGGPAFPMTRTELRDGKLGHDCMCTGMSLRFYLAAAALPAVAQMCVQVSIAAASNKQEMDFVKLLDADAWVNTAFLIADKMLIAGSRETS